MTIDYEVAVLPKRVLETATILVACGLTPDRCKLFVQSHVPDHTELAWIFNCVTPIGELERMTQFKEKGRQHRQNINMGFLDYPVLLAADILIYKADYVPVGEDQIQHVELAARSPGSSMPATARPSPSLSSFFPAHRGSWAWMGRPRCRSRWATRSGCSSRRKRSGRSCARPPTRTGSAGAIPAIRKNATFSPCTRPSPSRRDRVRRPRLPDGGDRVHRLQEDSVQEHDRRAQAHPEAGQGDERKTSIHCGCAAGRGPSMQVDCQQVMDEVKERSGSNQPGSEKTLLRPLAGRGRGADLTE